MERSPAMTRLNDRAAAGAALGVLAAHNLVQNFLLNERGYVTGNLAVAGLLVGVGRSAGCRWEEMGLHPDHMRPGLRMGTRGAAATAAAVVFTFCHPRSRSLFEDDRARMGGPVWLRALTRFPLGTAVFEEVAFRGVLPAVLRRHRPAIADAVSATAFGLWHLVPTATALAGNTAGRRLPPRRRPQVVLGAMVATGVGGALLSWSRRRTGSLITPWLVHASLNTFSFLASVAALRLSDSPGTTDGDERNAHG